MKQSEFLAAVAAAAGFSQVDTAKVIDAFTAVTATALSEGKDVGLAGFGKFAPSDCAARTGRNPQTGEAIQIPAKTVVTFKPAKALADKVNG